MITNKKPTVVWFTAITCNGNTHSLLSANSNRFELFLNSFDFIYHPSLTIDKSLEDILNQEERIDFLLIEGSISSNKDFFTLCEDSTFNHLNKLALNIGVEYRTSANKALTRRHGGKGKKHACLGLPDAFALE